MNINLIMRYNNSIHFAKMKIFTFCEMNVIIYLALEINKIMLNLTEM